jgi:hypothetical protein
MARETLVIIALVATGCSDGSQANDAAGASSSDASCALTAPGCKPDVSDCVALTDNRSAAVFGLRLSNLRLTAPPALSTGVISTVIASSIGLDYAACPRSSSGASVFEDALGTFSWLLEIDTSKKTLKTGGALPVADPLAGYCFGDPARPAARAVTAPVSLGADGAFATSAGVDVVVPVYLDASGSSSLALPIRGLRFEGTLSPDHNCIGSYNAKGLRPADGCAPDREAGLDPFLDGGRLEGFITVADADATPISALQGESLCALIAGKDDGKTPRHCPAGQKGDWCSTTNTAGGCADAFRLAGTFAASGIAIHGDCK